MHSQGIFILSVSWAVVAATGGTSQTMGAQSVPDFSGVWGHPSLPGFEPPASGPGPVLNKVRVRTGPQSGRSAVTQLVGDYSNPILKPQAAEAVKKFGEIELSGRLASPTPINQCWPAPPPLSLLNTEMQMLQQPHQITILYVSYEVRHVRMNASHPARVTPSWYGDSVGHYDGDTLVIDTVGIKTDRPFAMVDLFGTPYTEALHVVERYRLIDYEAAKEGLERDTKENFQLDVGWIDRSYKGKHLQLQFTVEDEGVFTIPWSATITYRPNSNRWPEMICAENPHWYYAGRDALVPRADKLDF